MADNAENYGKKILDCTETITSLGKLHRGSHLAYWATTAGNMVNMVKITNTRIVDTLKQDPEVLETIAHEFHKILKFIIKKVRGLPALPVSA